MNKKCSPLVGMVLEIIAGCHDYGEGNGFSGVDGEGHGGMVFGGCVGVANGERWGGKGCGGMT